MTKGQPQDKGLFVSKSAIQIGRALIEKYPKDAEQIIQTMSDAADNRSMRNKLSRVRLALVLLRQGGAL